MTMIASYVGKKHRQWDKWLSELRCAINTAWQKSTSYTPNKIVLARKLKGSLEKALPRPSTPYNPTNDIVERQESMICLVKENVKRAQANQKQYYDLQRKQTIFQEEDVVLVRTPLMSKAEDVVMAKLSPRWKGPAKVHKHLGPVNLAILFLDNLDTVDSYCVKNVKPFHGCIKSSN